MSNKQSPSTPVVVALAVVALAVLASGTLMVLTVEQSEIPQGWLGILTGILGTLVTALVTLTRTEQVNKKVDRMLNGEMDKKIEDGAGRALDKRERDSREDQ